MYCVSSYVVFFFFVKQKTAYEMRISDWSSDVCSSDLDPSIDYALTIMLAALAMLGLGIFGPGIATGLVSGAPQLGAGAVAGTALGAAGAAVAVGAVATGGGGAVAAGARIAPGDRKSVG